VAAFHNGLERRDSSRAIARPAGADRLSQKRLTGITDELVELKAEEFEEGRVATTLESFDELWGAALKPKERTRVVSLLVKQVVYDATDKSVSITFRSLEEEKENAA